MPGERAEGAPEVSARGVRHLVGGHPRRCRTSLPGLAACRSVEKIEPEPRPRYQTPRPSTSSGLVRTVADRGNEPSPSHRSRQRQGLAKLAPVCAFARPEAVVGARRSSGAGRPSPSRCPSAMRGATLDWPRRTMSTTPPVPVINDMSLQVATVNGSGSQSANMVLLRTLFQMGVPVSGKNLFPSNIAGLPTWYTIRACKDGWIARKKEIDLLVAMNPETAREDVLSLRPGSSVVFDEPLKVGDLRSDLAFYAVPFDKVIQPVTNDAKVKKLLKNMAYVGVVAQLLGLEMPEVEAAIAKQFRKKAKAAELNVKAARAGQEYTKASLQKHDPFEIRRMDANRGKIIIEGNAAGALGAMFGGVTVVTWYPITPSSSLVETLIGYMRRYRMGADGKSTYAIVQAEDELAAVGMVVGAGWAGARAMTSTAGPGISLMAEFAGLA